jgi:heme A synthase
MTRAQRFAAVTAVATFILLCVGGLVNPTGSSLACPEPTLICNGSLFPDMVGGVLFEHGHRLVAMTVGLMTCVLGVLLWREGKGRQGALAVALVVAQGLLGAVTVRYKLPPAVSITHLAVSMAFFCYVIALAIPQKRAIPAGLHARMGAAAALVYAQVILGGLVRHSHAATACADEIPLCFGQLWPLGMPFAQQIHMAHRLFALVAGAAAFYVGLVAARRLTGRLRAVALAVPAIVVVQIGLGVWTVLTLKGLVPVELHLAVGALLLAATATLALATRAEEPA